MNRMRRAAFLRVAAFTAVAGALAAPARASRDSEALRAKASIQLYNLDRDQALATFREAAAADPNDAAAYRGVATALWLSITFRRGNMTVDDYLGRETKPTASAIPAPPEAAAAFRDASEHAIALARKRIAANAKDADAHFQLGAAVGLQASYTATVDGRVLGAFRAAREAYDEHERVLELDPRRKDAGLIVGTYRYIVSALALPLRLMAYVVGFGGGREKGLQMIEEAASYFGDNQDDARFALVLLYNRERRYDDALNEIARLRQRFPRNRLMWLEGGSTSLRAGHPVDADRVLTEGLTRFADDRRERMFGENALWYYKRGAARVALGRAADADADLARALALEGRKWVHGRAHIEVAKLALKRGDRARAQQELRAAIPLCESDNDPEAAAEARRLLK
jgi:tetratricopeptide (TPR) repeat protein